VKIGNVKIGSVTIIIHHVMNNDGNVMNNDGNASNLHIDRVLVVVVLEKAQLQEKKPWTLLYKC